MVRNYSSQQGFTFVGILIIVGISGIALSVVGEIWHQSAQREKEKELLFIGNQYRLAIVSYYDSTPGGVKQYPQKLEDLLLDKRLPVTKRHLRRLYQDPISKAPLALIKQGEAIVGVHSISTLKPIKRTGFPERYVSFAEASAYDEWKFVASSN
jgi:type II secretory pathway pseudopilin PulG